MKMMRHGRVITLLLVALPSPLALAQEQRQVVVISGAVQGAISGGSGLVPGAIDVEEYHHLISRPQAVQPEHREVIFTKRVDPATPPLWQAFYMDESLTVRFELRRDFPAIDWLIYQQIELTGASIHAIEQVCLDPSTELVAERIRLRYSQMTLTNNILNPDGSVADTESYTINGNFPGQ